MIYFHIGHPKVMSTTIQYYLSLIENENNLYLGFRPNSDPSKWYINKLEQNLFDYDLRFSFYIF